MPKHALIRSLVVGSVSSCALVACNYDFPRQNGVGDGEITAHVLREDGTPATAAHAEILGSQRVVSVDVNGNLHFRGLGAGHYLVRITEDDESDGVIERGTNLDVTLENKPVPKNFTDGLFGPANVVTTSVLLGDVTLEGTGSISGQVHMISGGTDVGVRNFDPTEDRARIVVWRTSGTAPNVLQLPIEASGGVDQTGTFHVAGILPGAVQIAMLVGDVNVTPYAETRMGTSGTKVKTGKDQNIDGLIDQIDLVDTAGKLKTQTVQVQIAAPTTPDSFTFTFTQSGTVNDRVPPVITGDDTGVVDAPVGISDIAAQVNADGTQGVVRGIVVVPTVNAVVGPLEIRSGDPCAQDGGRDCDDDGLPGLALLPDAASPNFAAVHAQWAACAPQCAAAFGKDKAHATCLVDGSTFDCDDDGDGQPDVTEPTACIAPGAGTDSDGDGQCEPDQDGFALCAANDPTTCPVAFVAPGVRPEYQ
jgi:hypothetical protein